MTRTVTFLVTFLFVGLMASPSVQPAEANWQSSFDGPSRVLRKCSSRPAHKSLLHQRS